MSFTLMVFLTLLRIKEFIAQQQKCGNGLKPVEFTLITSLITQKQPAQMRGGVSYWGLRYSSSWETSLQNDGCVLREQHVL